jgi:hypothetical protein
MAKRPITTKKMNKLRKLLRRTPDSYINLIGYLIDRKHVNTVGGARALLVAGKVMVDSHIVGRKAITATDPSGEEITEYVPDPFIKAEYRDRIIVAT